MSRMKHLLRKLHIGGGGGDLEHQSNHHHRLVEPKRETPPPSTTTPPASLPSPSLPSTSHSPSGDGTESRVSRSWNKAPSTATVGGGGDFSLLEEEYQVQLALAISASDPNGIDDLDSVQIKAAKQMSLETAAAAATSGCGGNTESDMEFLSLRYWSYNVVNYDEKLMDGFYDVHDIISNNDRKMPSLVDLLATSVSESVGYEVVLLNRTVDSGLQQLERKALLIASECKAIESGPIASGLVQKIAHLVAENMGGPVDDAEGMHRRWMVRSHELRTSLNSVVLPLGLLEVGLSRHRAFLFKVIADRIDLPCKMVKGSHYTGTDEGAINLIKVDYESEYIIDLMGAPGTLIPAEVPSSHLQNSGTMLHCADSVEQSVKDLCLALDKLQEKSEHFCAEDDFMRVEGNRETEGAAAQTASAVQRDDFGITGAISPDEQMKVNDVSKYVVTAAKDPEFARKLHAVLLESGASPPLDLFSNLNTVYEMVEQRIPTNNISIEGTISKKGELPQPYILSVTEEGSLSCGNIKSDHEKNVVEMTAKDEHTPPSFANSALARKPSPFERTNQNFFLNKAQLKVRHATAEADTRNAKTSTEQSEAKEEVNNYDMPMPSGSEKESFTALLDGVADWEIPWEDLQIGERIGLGSYGEVYRADWNGTDVAVKKFLDQDLSGDALELFRCEVKIMLRLRHPNVVLFMGAVTRPPNLSILTEFLPRGSLYRLLHRPNVKLEEKRRMKMALDVAKGMNYLHTSQTTIVHRDLKSPNLLVDRNWVVKVCDFGLSRLKHHTFLSSKSTAGTPEWMAPEVLRNEPSNEKCDVYSFGVILWELATLRMPWSGMNPMQVVGAVGYQNKRLDIPLEIDPMTSKIITDCWESDPSQRPSFAQLLPHLKQLRRLVVPGS